MLHKQLSLDARYDSDVPLKLHVLLHSFAIYQDAELPLQATCYKLVHLDAIYYLKLHIL